MFDWHLFNYTDFTKINLDWITDCLKALLGGSTNQILSKKSDNDFDFEWVNKPEVTPGIGLTEEIKQALLQLARKVAYIDNQGETYYQDLYDALYNEAPPVTLVSIDAVYTQSGTVYDTDTLNSLKADLVVTATYSDSTTAVIPAADYTLSGTLTVGSSVITVSYGGKTDTFTVAVTENPAPPVTLVSIEAVYTQSGTVYDIDTLDSLKADLVVTAIYSDSTTAIIPAADYILSGTLTVGSSIITVSYDGKTDTFTVTVTAATLLYVGASYGYGSSGGTVTFNQDGSITFISTGNTHWGLCYSPYGDANAFKTFEQIKGHTVRLVYTIDWTSTTASTRLLTSAHFFTDLTKYDMTRLRYTNYFDSNANPEYLIDRNGYVDLLIPNDVSSWDGTGTVTDSSYFGFRTYVISNTAGANVTITQRFYDLGVV